ncbi:protein FAM162B [Chanos chanos]|uniref:Protein FAM162B n=1 Tax=Chanos chanos TaxID=29144 RepID=A0A6J2UXZ2_CHACN|nr:protein FAM162A [Chanos chanos]
MIFNAITRSRSAMGTFMGQWRRLALGAGSRRRLCSKPQEGGAEQAPAHVPPHTQRLGFRVPGYRPSDWDRKVLVWSGRFKTKEQIPEIVSFEMIDAARNRVRVKICYIMMGLTILSCLFMVFLGKKAAGRNENLTTLNMEKKARWREELRAKKEAEASAAMAAEKAQ